MNLRFGRLTDENIRLTQIDHDGAVDDDDANEVCIIGAIALGIIFKIFDEELVPVLPLGVDFDVIIVAMFTCVRVAMSGIVESCISQAAWIWVSDARQSRTHDMRARLEDFKIYDEASRGLWGSICLIWRLRARHLACIGALIVILVHGLEASSQQLYQYEPRQWKNDTAGLVEPPPRMPGLNVSTKAAIYSGILSLDVKEIGADCKPENHTCTWKVVPTLAVCGECNKLSVETVCSDKSQTCLYKTPSGTSFDVANSPNTEKFKVTNSRNGIFHHINSTSQTYISVFDVLWVSRTRRKTKILAHECALWFCMKTYMIEVGDGGLNQTYADGWNTTRFEKDNSAHFGEYVFDNIPEEMHVEKQSRYSITKEALAALQRFIDPLLEGTYEHQYTIINFSSEWVEGLYNAQWNLEDWIRRFSTSLTNEVRLHGQVRNKRKDQMRYGCPAFMERQKIIVAWWWLVFPTSLIVISIYYLFHTIIRGARDNISVWKSDSLPMLFCRIDPSILLKVGDGMDLPNGLDKRVGDVKVCLLREEDGDWVFKPIESEESSSDSDSERGTSW
ncbi:hypothetical protein CKAH01_14815 [Colletotrichum kahawae]|uniref:Uncharacterized protein n=1 Tax=Colletotrichum kahawae TaxID=34407 RepID=A0AAD9YK10_COLKA|nr:hypothetical protein CKAH01_14815 [Colletotrichum kahawae]